MPELQRLPSLQAIFECVYGPGTTVRLKQAGMEFAVWVFKHASAGQLQAAAPEILRALLALLDDGESCSDAFTAPEPINDAEHASAATVQSA